MTHRFPYMEYPLTDSVEEFLDHIEGLFTSGVLTLAEYHVSLGKALAYVESQFASGQLPENQAYDLIHEIKFCFF